MRLGAEEDQFGDNIDRPVRGILNVDQITDGVGFLFDETIVKGFFADQSHQGRSSSEQLIADMAAHEGVRKGKVPEEMMGVGIDDLEQVDGGLPDDEAVIEPDAGVGQAHFLESCEVKKVFEMAPVLGGIDDDAVFGQAAEPVNLSGVEPDVPEKEIPQGGRKKTRFDRKMRCVMDRGMFQVSDNDVLDVQDPSENGI